MTQADQIRQFIVQRHIAPARSAGRKEITLRAGDIHKQIGLVSRMPAVCSALEGRKLCELAAVAVKRRQGPPQGANVFVTYDLRKSHITLAKPQPIYRLKPAKQNKILELNSATALVLVSCVKSKLRTTAPAQDLYTSTLFNGMRSFALTTTGPALTKKSRQSQVVGLASTITRLAPILRPHLNRTVVLAFTTTVPVLTPK